MMTTITSSSGPFEVGQILRISEVYWPRPPWYRLLRLLRWWMNPKRPAEGTIVATYGSNGIYTVHVDLRAAEGKDGGR